MKSTPSEFHFHHSLDPEDIQSLSSHPDDVIDGIADSVQRMLDYHIDPMPGNYILA
jgi:hypothetical protein